MRMIDKILQILDGNNEILDYSIHIVTTNSEWQIEKKKPQTEKKIGF